MIARARLQGLRLQGFKSFADRTSVEFGPGISAVVGPNGSGKSNLADGLRWALGEQGRSLRIRKSEDVIWAGSERRPAVGMADVTLVIDNADALLPVEFETLEIGRRLFRSGENDYLLNRQRIRLRDLVDLLDSAHLAENAFLFIGQGMVDQALALRPEERRGLFEEVAGVRRPERRRRRAEDQLAESEANLARIEDILGELRPQVRRLAAQAEQQASRATAAGDLLAALIAYGHARWHDAAAAVERADAARRRATSEADAAMADLAAAESAATAIAVSMAERTTEEAERRGAHDAAAVALTDLRLAIGGRDAEVAAAARDRRRLVDERAAAQADLAVQQRALAAPVPGPDLELEAAASEAERALAEASAELAALRSASRDRDEAAAAVARVRAARETELETARRRSAEAARRAEAERRSTEDVVRRRAAAEQRHSLAVREVAAATGAAASAASTKAAARGAAEAREAEHRQATDRLATARSSLAALQSRYDSLAARLAEDEARGIARAARRRGGRRLDEDLLIESSLRSAVEAALAELARAYVVDADAVEGLAGERGVLVVGRPGDPGGAPAGRGTTGREDPRDRRTRDRIEQLGGGPLAGAIQRDPTGVVGALLERVGWLPDLAACLAAQADLGAGWLVVARDGSAVVGPRTVHLGRTDGHLERRSELGRLEADLERRTVELTEVELAATAVAALRRAATDDLARAIERDRVADGRRQRAEADERTAARDLDRLAREAAWQEAQAGRLESEASRLAAAVAAVGAELEAGEAGGQSGPRGPSHDAALATLEGRVADLRARRDRLAAGLGEQAAERRAAEARRARAEALASTNEVRLARTEQETATLEARAVEAAAELDRLRSDLATASAAEAAARARLDELRAADAADRGRLAEAERSASAARERLRSADERLRRADHAELEARLALDALREQLLLELAGLGDPAIRRLDQLAEGWPSAARHGDDDDADGPGGALQAALAAAGRAWATNAPPADAPAPGRLAVLRRRFHELGGADGDAIEAHAALRTRLDELETQDRDLRTAIAGTRQLIAELDDLIATQFRVTFEALEAAFDARFQQLFGGGYARLSLTDPGDLAATGIEIVARPPGRKPQALAMLSGGERALTAVALLFSMLEIRPVPFCVLDEVDAALDEANVGRFTAALRDLARQTQFIVITHNRGTIEAADALYGVTSGDDSVSRIVSLRLEEAQAIAGRQAEAVAS